MCNVGWLSLVWRPNWPSIWLFWSGFAPLDKDSKKKIHEESSRRSGPFSTPNHPRQGCVPTLEAGTRPCADDEEAWEPKRASKAVVPAAHSPRRWWPNRVRPEHRAADWSCGHTIAPDQEAVR